MRNDWSGTATTFDNFQHEPEPVFFPPNVSVNECAKNNLCIWRYNINSRDDRSVFWPSGSNAVVKFFPVISCRPRLLYLGV